MKTRARFAAIVVAILALAIGFLTEYFLTEGLSFDVLLTLRHLVSGDRHQTSGGQVVVVNIDEATFEAREFADKPFALWAPQFGAVLDALDSAGAKVIGLDIIFATTAESVQHGYDRPLIASLYRLGADDRVVLAQTDAGGKSIGPHKSFRALPPIGRNIRSANVRIDLDGVVRLVPLWQAGNGSKKVPGFALTLAQRAGFDTSALPGNMRFLAPNYADATVAPVYSMQDVYACATGGAAEPLKAAFAGKIVLIGAELDIEDRKVTPGRMFTDGGDPQALPCAVAEPTERASRRTMPGVFIHAQAVNDLLRGELARFWPLWARALALAAMAAAGSALAIFLRAQAASLAMGAALVVWVAGTTGATSFDSFGPLLGGVTAGVAAFLIGLGLRTFVLDRERRKMALALSRYLDFRLAQQLIASDTPPELGGETREVTIWFSDIAGFSTYAEQMDAKELVSQLIAHFTMIAQAIEAEGGIIDKYVGDSVVAIFGAPVPMPDHAARAMRAALAVQERLRKEEGKAGAFRIRIGINTGQCVVGNVGSDRRFDYTAIGDTVNVGQRLEAANKELGTMILASDSTLRAAGSGFMVRSLGSIAVKGRVEPVTVHEVIGIDTAASGAMPIAT